MSPAAGEQPQLDVDLAPSDAVVAPSAPANAADNPFASASNEFFPSGQRKRLLDQLRHLSQWSRRALLVTGPAGSGKTVLFSHLARALGKDASLAALSASSVGSRQSLFSMLASALGIDQPADAQVALLSDLVRGYVQAQNEAERLCVFLVDDAHLLDLGTLEALLALSAECRVRLIFFGDPGLAKRVDKAAVSLEIACHETPLLSLSAADTRSYVEWRVKQLGYTRMPFTEEQFAKLFSESEGIPGRIDELASRMLHDLSAIDVPANTGSGPLFPLPHLWIALALAAVLVLLYLLFDTAAPPPAVVAPVASADIEAPLVVTPAAPRPSAAKPLASQPEQASVGAPTARSPEQPISVAPEATTRIDKATESGAADAAVARTSSSPKPAAATAARVALPKPVPSVAVDPANAQPLARAEPGRTDSTGAQAARVEPALVEPAPGAAVIAAVPGVRGGDWLLAQEASAYTVQLLTVGNPQRMIDYLQKQSRPDRFAVYTRSAKGKLLYVTTYGIYATRGDAELASRQLPDTVGAVQPWIRSLKDLHQTVAGGR